MYNLLEETGRIDTAWQALLLLGVGLRHYAGFTALDFVSLSFAWVFGAWVGAPERGFLALDEPVGRYPTVTTPRTKPITPKEGVTDETPTTKNPPKRREGGHVYNIALEITCRLEARFNRVLLGGVVIIEGMPTS